MDPRTATDYRPDIDGLRTLAVLAVVLFHSFPDLLPGGFVGVDVFFVISGYLISGIILKDASRGQFSIGRFYSRRIARIFPALVTVLAATLLAAWVTLFPDEFRQFALDGMAGVAFISNLVLWQQVGYFDAAALTKPLRHLWSLGIEEQFYIFWPLLLAACWKLNPRKIMPTVLAVILVSLALNLALIGNYPSATFFFPMTRVWELAVGSALAVPAFDKRIELSPRNRDWLAMGGAFLVGLAIVAFTEGGAFPGWRALLPTLGTACLIQAGPSAMLNRTVLSSRPAVAIGLMSYPLYLWHWPLLVYLKLITESDFALTDIQLGLLRAAAVGTAFLLAWLTWKYIETPIRFSRQLLPEKRTRGLVLAMLTLYGICAAAYNQALMPRLAAQNGKAPGDPDWSYPDKNFMKSEFAVNIIPGASVGATLFVGDSHMEQYWPRVEETLRGNPQFNTAIFATHGGCPPLPGLNMDVPGYHCPEFYNWWLAEARKTNVNTIVIGAFWEKYILGEYANAIRPGHPVKPYHIAATPGIQATPADFEKAWRGLEATVASLRAAGKRVVLLSSNPTSPLFDPAAMLHRFRGPDAIGRFAPVERADFERFLRPVEEQLAGIAIRTGAILIHPADFLCANGECPSTDVNGSPLYKDADHLRPATVRERAGFLDSLLVPANR